ncbi:14759_t:CDS:2 [Gigaspora rosea]|nr:14759_t:CDS:2 [Gigaspora rosea]
MSIKPSSIEKILQWQYQYNAIKVNDGKFHSKHLKILGYVAIDVRPCFMKLYSKAEKSSLAFFLNEYGLESKLDMSFHRMFKYYEGTLKETNDITTEQMHEIAEYCINDALSCQWLMIKRNVINEYREVASIAFILLFDTHYFAVGMKVRNLLSTNAWREGILTSTIPCEQTETGKYPGAYVFPPVKGLENKRPLKDDNEVDEDEVNKDEVDEEDEDEVDEDKVSKIRDALAQKSAEKWVRGYIKNLHEGPKKDETIIAHLWKEAHTYAKNLYDTTYADKIVKCSENNTYWSFFLSALDKQEESIRIKLTTLLAEISQDDIGNREEMYKLVTKAGKHKSKAMTLEKYMLTYIQENEYEILADLRNTWYKVVGLEITRYRASSKLQGDKKDNSSEADIDEIIELYY